MQHLKQKLYQHCRSYIAKRLTVAEEAIREAQASANEETKSSAGDKYETGRAMMQLEIEKNSIQLQEALKLQRILDTINPEKKSVVAEPGSLVKTDQNYFYIAVSIGQVVIGGLSIFVVSADSPIGMRLKGLKQGQVMTFNSKTFNVEEIW